MRHWSGPKQVLPEWLGRSSGPESGPRRPLLPCRPCGWLPSSPTPREVPASPGFVVTRSWSLSRSEPLAELFDAKNRLFHRKTQRKIHFMSQKELQLGVFFLPLRGLDSEGGSIRWGRLSGTPGTMRGLWADGISGRTHCGQVVSPVPYSLGPRFRLPCAGASLQKPGELGPWWDWVGGQLGGGAKGPGEVVNQPPALPVPLHAAQGSGLLATKQQQKSLRALPRVPSPPAHPGRKEAF